MLRPLGLCLFAAFVAFGGVGGAAPVALRGVVFIADDAGDASTFTENFRQAVQDCRCPLQVVQIRWSIGTAKEDIQNRPNQHRHGYKLAMRIMAIHHSHPGTPIYLVGFGGGAAVVISAAERLPYHSVARIVLLAPALSSPYDLRPALCASCEGIDNFFSNMDNCLHWRTKCHGNADGAVEKSAGMIGFNPQIDCPRDAYIYAGLRQQRMDMLLDFDHTGGHHGYENVQFLRSRVISLICRPLIPHHR